MKKTMRSLLVLAMLMALVFAFGTNAMAADAEADTDWYDDYPGKTTYVLEDTNELAGLAQLVNNGNDFTGITVKLSNGFDGEYKLTVSIGNDEKPFNGTFDGNHKTVTLNITKDFYAGLFGYVDESGIVKNVNTDGTVNCGSHTGGIVGYNKGNIINCHSTCAVSGSQYLGGVAGYNDGVIVNCSASGDVVCTDGFYPCIGGVVGSNQNIVQNCYATGTVSASGKGIDAGGVAGSISPDSKLINCYAAGSVTANGSTYAYAGGIAGSRLRDNYNTGIIQNCYCIGEDDTVLWYNYYDDNYTPRKGNDILLVNDGCEVFAAEDMKLSSGETALITKLNNYVTENPGSGATQLTKWSIMETVNSGFPYIGQFTDITLDFHPQAGDDVSTDDIALNADIEILVVYDSTGNPSNQYEAGETYYAMIGLNDKKMSEACLNLDGKVFVNNEEITVEKLEKTAVDSLEGNTGNIVNLAPDGKIGMYYGPAGAEEDSLFMMFLKFTVPDTANPTTVTSLNLTVDLPNEGDTIPSGSTDEKQYAQVSQVAHWSGVSGERYFVGGQTYLLRIYISPLDGYAIFDRDGETTKTVTEITLNGTKYTGTDITIISEAEYSAIYSGKDPAEIVPETGIGLVEYPDDENDGLYDEYILCVRYTVNNDNHTGMITAQPTPENDYLFDIDAPGYDVTYQWYSNGKMDGQVGEKLKISGNDLLVDYPGSLDSCYCIATLTEQTPGLEQNSFTIKSNEVRVHIQCSEDATEFYNDYIDMGILPTENGGYSVDIGYLLLAEDIQLDKPLVISGDVILDLDGHVLSAKEGSTGFSLIIVTKDARLTIFDSNSDNLTHNFKVAENGLWSLTNETTDAVNFEDLAAIPETEDIITLTGGCITGGVADYGAGIYNCGGTVVLNGGNVVGNMADDNNGYYGDGGGIYNGYMMGALYLNGGKVIGNIALANERYNDTGCGGGIYNEGLLTVNDGGGVYYNTAVANKTSNIYYYNGNGGGIYNEGLVTLNDGSAVIGNAVVKLGDGFLDESCQGGGIFNEKACSETCFGRTAVFGIVINGGNISGNTAYSGGGICNWGGEVTLNGENAAIKNNTADFCGGGILNSYYYDYYYDTYTPGVFQLKKGTVAGNTAIFGGGAYDFGSTMNLTGGSIADNNAARSVVEDTLSSDNGCGGGIYSQGYKNYNSGTVIPSEINLNGTAIKNNTAEYGGGIYLDGYSGSSELTAKNSTVSGNKAHCSYYIEDEEATYYYGSGGGVYSYCGTAKLVDMTVTGNSADYGGGIYNEGYLEESCWVGVLTLDSTTVSDNEATCDGGGLYNDYGYSEIVSGSEIKNNVAQYGGGIYNDGCSYEDGTYDGYLKITDSSVSNNALSLDSVDKTDGGGIYNDCGVMEILRSKINNNSAYYGGGIVSYGYTYEDGGEEFYACGKTSITDSTLQGNQGVWGGAINNGDDLTLNNVTITGNTVTCSEGTVKEDFGGAGIDFWGGSITLAGKTVIQNNLTNSKADNLFMEFDDNYVVPAEPTEDDYEYFKNNPLVIGTNGLTTGASIGINHYMVPTDTAPVCVVAANAKNYSSCFTSDDGYYINAEADNALYLSTKKAEPAPTPEDSAYKVNISACTNGTVTASAAKATAGTAVTLKAKGVDGYTLKSVTATAAGKTLTLTPLVIGASYSFTMPAGDVTVTATFTNENPFVDVKANAYYFNAVLWAATNKVTTGTDNTHFSPELACTRGQIVTFLWRAAGCPEPAVGNNPFTDVTNSKAYYYKAVLWAVEKGITKGLSDTVFGVNNTCTRGQTVTFLYRYVGEQEVGNATNPFTDVKAGTYYYDAVLWAVSNGVTKGTSDTTFSPKAKCTRGQIVTFLYRALVE